MADTSIAFIGFGLIGGSIAKGLKRSDPNITVMAYMRTTEKLRLEATIWGRWLMAAVLVSWRS